MSGLLSVALLTGLMALCAAFLAFAQRRWQPEPDTLVDAIDALLPQTQCAQCGYAGCRPYARAVADGETIDKCPPGGPETQQRLARLLGRSPGVALDTPQEVLAVIDESACIGCFLCVRACPVDAIIGAPQYQHTVLAGSCTGCELCVPACPVDCIALVPRSVR